MAAQKSEGRSESEVDRFRIGQPGSPKTLELVRSLAPDVIAVACFPRRLPGDLLRLARLRAVNVHPSLLPLHRGPDPLFWTLRRGTGDAGVSVHEMVEEFDAGPVLARQRVKYPDGTTESELERELARVGGQLLAGTLRRIHDGTDEPVEQRAPDGSYESWPTDDDYVIDTRRSARSAFNFIRGVSERGVPVGVRSNDTTMWVRSAIRWSDIEPTVESASVAIRFSDGFLLVEPDRRAPSEPSV